MIIKMFRIANLTLESKFKVKYTCNQAVCIVMATPHEFFMEDIHIWHNVCLRWVDDKKAFGFKALVKGQGQNTYGL